MFSTTYILELISLFVIGILILMGNSLVILAFISGPRAIRTYTNYFVINLAVSDLLVGCISVPFWICVRLHYVDYDHPSFKYLMSLDILFGTTSILCLTGISLERMYAVKFPARHHNLNHQPVYGVIVGTWVFSVLLTFVKFCFHGDAGDKSYTIIILVLAFILPLLIIVVCYAVIFHTARNMIIATNQNRNLSRELRVAKTISVIIGLFVLCWLPFFILNILYYFCDACWKHLANPWILLLSKAMHFSNSMMNFFVYAVRSPDFRETFKALIFQKCNHIVIRERLRTLSKDYKNNSSNILTPDNIIDYSTVAFTSNTALLDLPDKEEDNE